MLLLALLACADKYADLPPPPGSDGGTDTGLIDADGDGWPASEDCDDTLPGVHPGATEIYYDDLD
jgi:hypothetical protein